MLRRLYRIATQVGPGIAIAATGVGAADLVTAAIAGARFGNALLWAAALGAIVKYVLNEGVARWQLSTGSTVFEGWIRYLGRWVVYCFLAYLVIWTFSVAGGLIVAAGVAAHSLVPQVPAGVWSVVQAILAYGLVLAGSYGRFEQLMKVLVGTMFVTIVGCTLASGAGRQAWPPGLSLPPDSLAFTLGLIGGVGGSVTMLAYGYWIQEKKWDGPEWLPTARTDLALGYGLTGFFAIGVILLSAQVLFAEQTEISGTQGVIKMAAILGDSLGTLGRWIFLIGFWGAVFSSLLGVFQGVPYLFCDFMFCISGRSAKSRSEYVHPKALHYRLFLTFMTFPPMILLVFSRPLWLVVLYAAVSSVFLPFLASTLLYLNNRTECIGAENRNGVLSNVVLAAAVALFGYLGFVGILRQLG